MHLLGTIFRCRFDSLAGLYTRGMLQEKSCRVDSVIIPVEYFISVVFCSLYIRIKDGFIVQEGGKMSLAHSKTHTSPDNNTDRRITPTNKMQYTQFKGIIQWVA